MIKEYKIRSGSKTIYLEKDGDAMIVSIYVPGGHLTAFLDVKASEKMLEAVKDIMEEK